MTHFIGYCSNRMMTRLTDLKLQILCFGQSYKGSTIVNYCSKVVIWGIFKSGTTLEL